ncbi:MAG: DUF58 domain-containing protein [Candidatus Omnitrophica bacterium]|nr:DUF58 domain-containing protein [Candidatus Omnitrophota bacterium]MCB9720983.1 DUF58 domain-containing protein [Candidatus Omnitrophota bacterium]
MRNPRWSFFLPARDHYFIKIFTALSYSWLTPIGIILITALFISTGIASPGLHISAYLLTCVILALMITSVIFSLFFIPKVELYRTLPDPPTAGSFMVYEVTVKNVGRRPVKNLAVNEGVLPYGLYFAFENPAYKNEVAYLAPGQSATVSLVIQCPMRGIYKLPRLFVGSAYPSNIVRWPVKAGAEQPLVVHPAYVSQSRFRIPMKNIYQPGGVTISSTIGDSNEFFSTREYRQGDRLRDIHWPSYAHTGKLIVKEYIDEYYVKTALILDIESDRRDRTEWLEHRISLAAGITDALANKGFLVDLFANGDKLYQFQRGNPYTYQEEILHIMAGTPVVNTVDFGVLEAQLMKTAHTVSTAIIILSDWDKTRSGLCHALRSAGVTLRILIVNPNELRETPDLDVTLVRDINPKVLVA